MANMSIIMVLVVIVGVLKGFKLFNSDNDNIYNYDDKVKFNSYDMSEFIIKDIKKEKFKCPSDIMK
jgi:hypothetical protein